MEALREVMRKWVTGVAVVTVQSAGKIHGMTVNSLASVSIDPPRIVVTLANNTRTHQMVSDSWLFGVTLLGHDQQAIAERFAGRTPDHENRFEGVDLESMAQNIPVAKAGLAQLACSVVHQYEMPSSTLFVAEVLQARVNSGGQALVYANRKFQQMEL